MARHNGPFEFERHEIAKSLFDQIKQMGGEGWVAVRIRDETAWEVCKPRSQSAMRYTLATDEPTARALKKDELYAMAREKVAADLADDTIFDGIDLALEMWDGTDHVE